VVKDPFKTEEAKSGISIFIKVKAGPNGKRSGIGVSMRMSTAEQFRLEIMVFSLKDNPTLVKDFCDEIDIPDAEISASAPEHSPTI
jgi:hypothetical protein